MESAIKANMNNMLRRSEKFAARMSMTRARTSSAENAQPQNQKEYFVGRGSHIEKIDESELENSPDQVDHDEKRIINGSKGTGTPDDSRGTMQEKLIQPQSPEELDKLRKKQLKEKNQKELTKKEKPSFIENMTPFVLMIGLGVHALFEGIALGISDDVDKTIIFAVAIILHKGAAGMSLGISMARTF